MSKFEEQKNKPVLIHLSKSPVSAFSSGTFRVRTGGRVYAMRLAPGILDSPTIGFQVKSALVFKDAAALKFIKHELEPPFFFKRIFGQYVSSQIGNIAWNQADARIASDVLEISDFTFETISDDDKEIIRKRNSKAKIFNWCCVSFIILLVTVLTLFATWGNAITEYLPILNSLDSILCKAARVASMIWYWVIAAVIAYIGSVIIYGRLKKLPPGVLCGLKELGYTSSR
ncbi:hypothetical protein [Pseudomonas savastanoi]|uniref:hypothetical protein n=1 Tax=Pseudomonas savastanoi TaxID=29438 RepID=UPI000760556C|nr:hypothetical protein [Pseudomonas savastanoi]KWT06121.1 hypothetical protein AL047_21935 [Pseudomonas syringae pv. broussonetiae]